MTTRKHAVLLIAAAALAAAPSTPAQVQTSASFTVMSQSSWADPGLAAGSAAYLASRSVNQNGAVGQQASARFSTRVGFQAMLDGLDTDYDGTPDGPDADADGDGVPDTLDARPYDTDGDGFDNLANDDDDDNDLLGDNDEFGAGTSLLTTDTDGDTYSDYEEVVVAGTDGTDGDDFLRNVRIQRRSPDVTITWSSVSGKTYYVQRNSNLMTTNWVPVTSVMATSTTTSATDPAGPSNCHYRVRIPY